MTILDGQQNFLRKLETKNSGGRKSLTILLDNHSRIFGSILLPRSIIKKSA